MPNHMKAVVGMLAYLCATFLPSSFAVIDGILHDATDSFHSVHATTENSTSQMAPAQQKETTKVVVEALKQLGFLSK